MEDQGQPQAGPAPSPPSEQGAAKARSGLTPVGCKHAIQVTVLVAAVAVIAAVYLSVAGPRLGDWGLTKTLVFSLPFALSLALVALFYRAMRNADRVRKAWVEANPDDPSCKNLLIVYNLSRKALYLPTIVVSVAMCSLMYLKEHWNLMPGLAPKLLGGIWLVVFFLNFLVEEYDVDLRCIVITIVVLAAAFMWVALMGWVAEFFRFFELLGIQIDAAGYLLISAVFVIAILYSVLRGSFEYVAITPNYINIQTGLAETGEQLGREQFSTRIEAEDLIERLFGFGRLVITFRDTRRPSLQFLVHRVGRKAAQLEAIRGTYLVDEQDPARGS